jgi:hypothetical protein
MYRGGVDFGGNFKFWLMTLLLQGVPGWGGFWVEF